MSKLYDFSLLDIDGNALNLSQFKGKPVLLVNVASKCGLTPQYEALQALYREYQGDGLVVLGIPCNQFGGQEPGTEREIKDFCSTNFKVSFPMSSKVEVNGEGRHPLYQWLAGDGAAFPGDITWNFEKFLISGAGEVVARFGPKTAPDEAEVKSAIERALP